MPSSEDWCGFDVVVPPIDWAAMLEAMRIESGGGGRRPGGGAPFATLNRLVTQTDANAAEVVQLGPGVQVCAVLDPEPYHIPLHILNPMFSPNRLEFGGALRRSICLI